MKRIALSLLLLILFSGLIYSQWEKYVKPYGVKCISASEGNIIVGTDYSIFMSADSGSTWVEKDNGLPIWCYVHSIIALEDTIIAGTDYGLFLSLDNGNSWINRNTGLPDLTSISSVAKVGSNLYAGTNYGVFLSADLGENWQGKSAGITDSLISTLLFNQGYLFAGTSNGGVFVSTDQAENWTPANNGLSNLSVTVLDETGGKIYLGTENGFYSSTNQGVSWDSIQIGSQHFHIRDIELQGDNVCTLIGDSIYFSPDNGANWTLRNDPFWNFQLKYNEDLSSIGTLGNVMFAFRDDGQVFRTLDNGTTWVGLNLSGYYSDDYDMIVNDNNILVSSRSEGVYISKDLGESWKSLNYGIDPTTVIFNGIARDGNRLLVSTSTGIYVSRNEGESWDKVYDYNVYEVAMNGSNAYAGGSSLYASSDSGKTWQIKFGAPTSGNLLLQLDGNNLFAASGVGLYLSRDSANTWVNLLPQNTVYDLKVDGDTLYAATKQGLLKSHDYGNTWTLISQGLPQQSVGSIDKRGSILVADEYISTDNGNEWKPLYGAGSVGSIALTEDYILKASYGAIDRLPFPILLVSRNSFSVYYPEDSGSVTIDIVSTTDWSTSKTANRFSLSDSSGSGHGSITITSPPNNSFTDWHDTLTILAAGAMSQIIRVNHYGHELELETDSLIIDPWVGSKQSFSIWSTTTFLLESDQDWLKSDKTFYGFEYIIDLTAESNPTFLPRIATLTISADGMEDKHVTVIQGAAQVNQAPSFTIGEDQTIMEDSEQQLVAGWTTQISAGSEYEDGQILTFSLQNNNPGLFSIQPGISPEGTLSYTPEADVNGVATITVILRDNGGTDFGGIDSSEAQVFNITVTAVNDAPGFNPGDPVSVSEDAGPQSISTWAKGISAGPTDESSQSLSFMVNNNNNNLFSVQPTISASGDLTFTPAENGYGEALVEVKLFDDGGEINGGIDSSNSFQFTITVVGVNDSPMLLVPLPDLNLEKGFQRSYIKLEGVFVDPDNDTLSYTASSSDEAIVTVSVLNDTLLITEVGNGLATIHVNSSDGQENTADEFNISVSGEVSTKNFLWSDHESPMTLYPNPTNSKTRITFKYPSDEKLSLGIFNSKGVMLFQKYLYPASNLINEELDFSEHQQGVYFLILKSKENYRILKLIVN